MLLLKSFTLTQSSGKWFEIQSLKHNNNTDIEGTEQSIRFREVSILERSSWWRHFEGSTIVKVFLINVNFENKQFDMFWYLSINVCVTADRKWYIPQIIDIWSQSIRNKAVTFVWICFQEPTSCVLKKVFLEEMYENFVGT